MLRDRLGEREREAEAALTKLRQVEHSAAASREEATASSTELSQTKLRLADETRRRHSAEEKLKSAEVALEEAGAGRVEDLLAQLAAAKELADARERQLGSLRGSASTALADRDATAQLCSVEQPGRRPSAPP